MIGILRWSALGDIAAALPVIRALKEKPVILTTSIGYELLQDEFDEFVILQSKNIKDVMTFILETRKKTDYIIDLQNNDRSRFVRFFFKSADNKGVDFNQSVTYIFYDIAKKSKKVNSLDINFIPKEKSYIVLNTGSSPKWRSKRLPFEKWKEFSQVLYEKFHLPFVLTGDKSEREYVQEVAKYIVGDKEIVAGKTSIQDLKKIVSDAYLCVSTDSAPMHIAAAQKTPTIGIFGATNWVISAPFGPWSVALYDKTQFQSPPKKNRLEIGNYYANIDINEGLKKLEKFL